MRAESEVTPLSSEQVVFALSRRVAHLSTADASGVPHVIPVCFALEGLRLYTPIDRKPKHTLNLKRLRNIAENSRVSLIFDRYDDDWSALGWVLIHGTGRVLEGGEEHDRAIVLLRQRYAQYAAMPLEELPIIAVDIQHVTSWGNLTP